MPTQPQQPTPEQNDIEVVIDLADENHSNSVISFLEKCPDGSSLLVASIGDKKAEIIAQALAEAERRGAERVVDELKELKKKMLSFPMGSNDGWNLNSHGWLKSMEAAQSALDSIARPNSTDDETV
jgi:hypothetical protein